MSFLQIGSWNIEHLSGQPREKKKQSAYALADHIEMAGIDLVVLQEIYVTDRNEEVRLFDHHPVIENRAFTKRRNSDLDIVCYLLEEHLKVKWQYIILPNKSKKDKSQLCAILWNTSRLTIGEIVPLKVKKSIDGTPLWDRRPHVVQFSTEIEVWRRSSDAGEWELQEEKRTVSIVPLHMKSNFGGITENRIRRGKEAETLCDALEKVKGKIDPSLILIGDTNVLKNDEPAIETFVSRGYIDMNNHDAATYWSKQYGESPFDRIFVPKGRDEFKYSRQYVLRSSDLTLHDKYLSDHYMIKMSVKNYLDDADPR